MYNSRMVHLTLQRVLLGCLLTLAAAGCRAREVEKDLRLTDVRTGWYDAGIVDGQNKLVPSVTLKVQNVSDESISNVQLNAIFRRVNEPEAWGDHLVRAIGENGLEPGDSGQPLVLRSQRGYTSTEPRLTMLEHKEFVDAKVEIFGKHRSRPWTKMGEFMIDRHLLTE